MRSAPASIALLSILITVSCSGTEPELLAPGRRNIHVSIRDLHVTSSGIIEKAPDLSDLTLAFHLPDGAGGFEVRRASPTREEVIALFDVPEGGYYFQLGTTFVATSESDLDLSAAVLGRPDTDVADISPTDLVLDLDGLSPWQSTDEIQVAAPDVGETYFFAEVDLRSAPTEGAERTDGARLDWSGRRLIQGSTSGDRLAVAQLVARTSPAGFAYSRVERFLEAGSFEQIDGRETRINGSMSSVPLDSTVSLDWKKSQFAAFGTDVHRRAEPSYEQLNVSVLPRAMEYGVYSSAPDLFYLLALADGVDIADSFAFGNPYPASWDKVVTTVSAFRIEYSIGSAMPARLYGILRSDALISETSGRPIRPALTPVRNIRINGREATADLAGVSATPMLTWDPPGAGTATGYVVRAIRLAELDGRTNFEVVANFYTAATELRVVPGALDPFGTYVFVIAALSTPDDSFATAPFRASLPSAYASAMTEKVVP